MEIPNPLNYKTASIAIAAVLVLSVLVVFASIPTATAALYGTASVDKKAITVEKTYGGAANKYGLRFEVTNPPENTLAIDRVHILVPSSWTDNGGTKPTDDIIETTIATAKITVVGNVIQVYDFNLPPGASITVSFGKAADNKGIKAPKEVEEKKADVYEFKIWTSLAGDDSLNLLSELPKVYVTDAKGIEIVDPKATTGVEVGGKQDIKFKLVVIDPNKDTPDEGVPLDIGFKRPKDNALLAQQGSKEYAGTLSATTIWTDANGEAKVTLTVDTKAIVAKPDTFAANLKATEEETGEDVDDDGAATLDGVNKYYTWAAVVASAWLTDTDKPAVKSHATSGLIVSKPGAPTQITVTLPNSDEDGTYYVTHANHPVEGKDIKAKLSDKYGNAVLTDDDSAEKDVTLTITDVFGAGGKFGKDGVTSITVKLPKKGEAAEVAAGDANDYYPSKRYGDYAKIKAEVTIAGTTYSGKSEKIFTSFLGNDVKVYYDDTAFNADIKVEAGGYTTITFEIWDKDANAAVKQSGVPVTFSFVEEETTEGYAGTLSATSAFTDSDGKVKVKLTVDTKKDNKAEIKATFKAPEEDDPAATFEKATPHIITKEGKSAALKVKIRYDTTEYETGVAEIFPTDTAVDIQVYVVDEYGNMVDITSDITVALYVVNVVGTAGALKQAVATITAAADSTGWIDNGYIASPNVGDEAQIKAIGGGLEGISPIIRTVSSLPKVSFTKPTEAYVNTATVQFQGWANATVGGRTIDKVEYSVDGGAFTEIAGMGGGVTVLWAFEVTLADGSHTIVVRATDSAGDYQTASTTIFVDTQKPTVTITSPAPGASVTARPTVTASFSDPSPSSGINTASVVVKVDGNVVTAGVAVTAAGVTFTPTTDLATGDHTVEISVADNAGNTATASVTFKVAIAVVGTEVFKKPDIIEPTNTMFQPTTPSANVGFLIHVKYTNKATTSQEVIMYVQIKNAAGAVVFLGAIRTTVGVGQAAEAYLGPAAGLPSGVYTVETFIWDADTLSPLGEMGTLTLSIP
jgi:hypothetical protein